MGMLLREDDIYAGTFMDRFNLRFGPGHDAGRSPGKPPPGMWGIPHIPQADAGEWLFGGIHEVVELQKEFEIFRKGRPFWKSAALLGLGGLTNHRAKNRWFTLLRHLANFESNKRSENGDERIVNALIANLARPEPLPCHMEAHDLRKRNKNRVIVRDNHKPIFYIDQAYLSISLPMKPRGDEDAAKPKRGRRG